MGTKLPAGVLSRNAGSTLKEETFQLIKDAIQKHFEKVFLNPKETATAKKAFESRRIVGDLRDTFKQQDSIGFWSAVEELRNSPEPTPEELQVLLKNVPQISYFMREDITALRKVLPHPPGGAPSKLNAQERKKAVRLVGTLMGQGDNYAEAVAKIAARFGVSRKTIQRAWQKAHPKKGKTGESK